jgi:hypothetical protein
LSVPAIRSRLTAIVSFAGCLACTQAPAPSPPASPAPELTAAPPAVSSGPGAIPDLELAVATLAAAGYDLDAELDPPPIWRRGCDPYADDLFTTAERPLLESFIALTHHARAPQHRRAALHHHITVRLARCDLREAVALLEAYAVEYDDDRSAGWAAFHLTDALTVLWQQGSTPVEILEASDRLRAWIGLVPSLRVWRDPDASELRDAVTRFASTLLWQGCKSDCCRSEGSFYDDGRSEIRARRCAVEYARLAGAFAELAEHESSVAPTAMWNAAVLFEQAGDLPRARAQLERLVERFPEQHQGKSAAERLDAW